MNYIHDRDIVHRYIKPSNVGKAQNGQWILFDFNNATRLKEENDYRSFSEGIGTVGYRAPEVTQVSGCSASGECCETVPQTKYRQ
jgi:serine/threonine protein kinase